MFQDGIAQYYHLMFRHFLLSTFLSPKCWLFVLGLATYRLERVGKVPDITSFATGQEDEEAL